jgi:hypothetical protein
LERFVGVVTIVVPSGVVNVSVRFKVAAEASPPTATAKTPAIDAAMLAALALVLMTNSPAPERVYCARIGVPRDCVKD